MASSALTIYEQPLTERLRTLLRIEFLLAQFDAGRRGEDEWHSRLAISALTDLIAVLSARSDLRSEFIKELERQISVLQPLEHIQNIDHDKLRQLLEQARKLAESLRSPLALPTKELKADELLAAVAQRSGIPGGTCSFDLPAFEHWLRLPYTKRAESFTRWSERIALLQSACGFILSVLRDSAHPRNCVAEGGHFQQPLERQSNCQLIRVALPAEAGCYPEISGSKHFITIRFLGMEDPRERPVTVDADVEFELSLCSM